MQKSFLIVFSAESVLAFDFRVCPCMMVYIAYVGVRTSSREPSGGLRREKEANDCSPILHAYRMSMPSFLASITQQMLLSRTLSLGACSMLRCGMHRKSGSGSH